MGQGAHLVAQVLHIVQYGMDFVRGLCSLHLEANAQKTVGNAVVQFAGHARTLRLQSLDVLTGFIEFGTLTDEHEVEPVAMTHDEEHDDEDGNEQDSHQDDDQPPQPLAGVFAALLNQEHLLLLGLVFHVELCQFLLYALCGK